ncbi:hypothetical protein RSSM_02343 [Rhodopirellula sallentina SM41]|uniref:Uncharacterized protein n=1 Tax=Rhodopirellula sallentina SM41 TaxID=1263870 RepID=M5UJP6_9BACT|nr:hypothetical protein RSSM_02343 [Rhodopirellula sallentina SM41]
MRHRIVIDGRDRPVNVRPLRPRRCPHRGLDYFGPVRTFASGPGMPEHSQCPSISNNSD